MTFEELYNSGAGIVGIIHCDNEQDFENNLKDLENNQDFSFLGQYDMSQDADEELLYQGFTLDQITKMSLNRYGNVIETLKFDDSYWVFVGAR